MTARRPYPLVRGLEHAGDAWTVREEPAADAGYALVFGCGREERRLAPVPADWPYWDDRRLREVLVSTPGI